VQTSFSGVNVTTIVPSGFVKTFTIILFLDHVQKHECVYIFDFCTNKVLEFLLPRLFPCCIFSKISITFVCHAWWQPLGLVARNNLSIWITDYCMVFWTGERFHSYFWYWEINSWVLLEVNVSWTQFFSKINCLVNPQQNLFFGCNHQIQLLSSTSDIGSNNKFAPWPHWCSLPYHWCGKRFHLLEQSVKFCCTFGVVCSTNGGNFLFLPQHHWCFSHLVLEPLCFQHSWLHSWSVAQCRGIHFYAIGFV